MNDDRRIFAMLTPAPHPTGWRRRSAVAALAASLVLLVVVDLHAGAVLDSSVPGVVVAWALLIASTTAAVVLCRPSHPTTAEDAAFQEGSRLMRLVALERFGVAFAADDNAAWLMRYGSMVDLDGRRQEVKVTRDGNAIALAAAGRQLQPLFVPGVPEATTAPLATDVEVLHEVRGIQGDDTIYPRNERPTGAPASVHVMHARATAVA